MNKKLLVSFLAIFLTGFLVNAQTNHVINTVGTTFSPDNITIDVGDTVTWNNTGGNHNVNGTTATFPSNPESFSNGAASSGWTFKHVFTIEGTYDYRCDPHAGLGMAGKVVVRAAMSAKEVSKVDFSIFPNPVKDVLNVKVSAAGNYIAKIYGMNGQLLQAQKINGFDAKLSIASFAKGIYFVKIESDGMVVREEKVVKL